MSIDNLVEIKAKSLGIPAELLSRKPETSIAEHELKRLQFNNYLSEMMRHSRRQADKHIAEISYVTKLHRNDKWPRMNKKKLKVISSNAFGIIFVRSVYEECNRKGFMRKLFEHKLEKKCI